ncbi:Fanconi anemia group A protein isoform X3 [Scleropages formosus]|uniref:Fanconi anemia group A protein isoform X3 n=1 Tax=Scleropages formosus TaxID=113540 RepID=UPI0010FA6AD1|nr:Fanconi anemia group A protein isoform X3 [Scleropages formosus]
MAEENRIMSMPQTLGGHRRPFSALLAAHIVKKPRYESEAVLHEAAVKLISRHQNLSDLLLEASRTPSGPTENVGLAQQDVCLGSLTPPETGTWATPLSGPGGSLIVHALQRQAVELGVPVGEVSAKLVAEKLRGLMGCSEAHGRRLPLNSTQRAELSVLVQSAQELLSHRAFSPSAFCRELWKALENPLLEVVWHFHLGRILTVEYILESEEGAESWLVTELRSLCGGTTEEQGQKEDKEVQKQILTGVVSVLVRAAFQKPQDPGSAQRNISQQCCFVLDDMLSCVLDSLHKTQDQQAGTVIAECWVQVLDSMSCDVTMSDDVLGCFFTHSLTYILTYRPQFKVSHAIAMQSEWCFAKTSRLLTALYRKLSILLSMEKLLSHLQQVLETDEVNWQHVLSFLSTLLVYYPQAQRSLIELLSRLLSSAFEGYDLENMITSFLLARQGALEGPAVFPSYSEWFKMSFGSASGYHGNSKKSIVFLLKFLSDLVPFDPPQYLKVHILYPPYVPVKHRTLLQEYVSLAKTRLADLKVSVDGMGLYEDLSGAAAPVQCQAKQDVDKAVSLFESTGKISTAVMEASIFRRPYFLSRFLPVLLTPRALPAKPDIRMAFIESLRKAEKIPSALYSNYIQACQRERERHRPEERGVVEVSADRQPLERLQDELQDLRHLLLTPGAEEVSAQLARISEALTVLVPEGVDEPLRQTIMEFHVDPPTTSDLENKVINSVLVGFCQIFMDASKINPPNSRQGPWASHFVAMLLGHKKLLMSLLHRLKDLLCNQGASLSAAHILGLAVFFVHLHQCRAICPLVLSDSTPCSEALAAALPCSTGADMSFCLRFCVAAVCYALCRSDSSPDRVHDYVPSSLCKKLLYLVSRLLPGTRTVLEGGGVQSADEGTQEEKEAGRGMWRNITDPLASWKSSVVALWRQPCFLALQTLPDYQLSFAEWVKAELRVQRSTDILSDPERQEYQQWVCQQQYLSVPLNQGGCAGDIRQACSHIFHAIMEFYTCTQTVQTTRCGPPEADSCLPDIVSRLQELVYELEMNRAFRRDEEDQRSFILDVISEKCSVTSESLAVSSELELQQTMHIWSRVVVALPPTVLLSVRSLGDKRRLDLRAFAEHINQRHRNVCVPAGRLPYDITAHFLKGVLTVSLRCDHPSQAVNKLLSRMHQQCPLLLVSVGVWWSRLCPVLLSLWTRLSGGPLPESLQRVADCCAWACSAVKGEVVPPPAVPALLLAACLHHAGKGQRKQCSTRRTLEQLGQLQEQHGLFPVFLLFFWVTDLLSTFLQLQKEDAEPAREHCMEILGYLCDTADWLLLFHPPGPEQGWYNTLAEVTTDGTTRLMPLAFYSLVPKLDTQVLGKMLKVPGFLLTALHSYSALTRLFLDGQTPLPDSSSEQADPLQILSQAKQFLLRTISLSPQTHFSENSSQALPSPTLLILPSPTS